jgi:hypothetical protein
MPKTCCHTFSLGGLLVACALCASPVSGQINWDAYKVRAVEFTQQEPDEGAPSTERTEVYLLYDAETLYIGFRAWDSAQEGVTATEMRRDSDRILEEDNFQIILDTFRDSRSGYMFVTNPLGAQLDQQTFNEGEGARPGFPNQNINRDWDGVWHVATKILDDGWVAEIAIPLVTLRFTAADRQAWGMNLMRNIGRKNEQSFWAPITKEFTIERVSLAGTVEGLQGLSRGLDLRVTPFATGGASSVLESQVTDESTEGEVGVDLKYGVTSGLNLDVTINTDFAQAEVDDEQVNLTRFPLFYPEKRDFFLENSGQFNVGSVFAFNRYADLFFSRNIGLNDDGETVPILAGARLTGKVGDNDIAVMDVQTDDAYGESGENFLVAKYSRNFWTRSRIGGLFINKVETAGDHYNRTYAIDLSLAPHPSFSIVGFMARTETPVTAEPVGDPDDFGESGSYVNAMWLDADWRIFGEYADFEGRFNPEVGFLPRRGIRSTKLHFEATPRPDWLGVRVLTPMINWTYTTDQNGRRLGQRWHSMLGTRFDNGAYLNLWYNDHFDRVQDDFVLNGVVIPAGDYEFGEWRFSFESNPAKGIYYRARYAPQGFYGGERKEALLTFGVRVSDRLSTEGTYTRNDVDLPNGDFVTDLGSLRVDLALSPTMTIRSVTQYNSSTDQFSTSARFRWTYRPGSDIYLVYDELRRDPDTMEEYKSRSLIVKATFLLSR